MAGQYAVSYVEMRGHWFIVRNTFGVVTPHNAVYFIGCLNGFFLHYFIIADDAENDFRGDDGKTWNFVIGKEFVAYLDDTFATNFLWRIIETDGDGGVQIEKPQQARHLIGLAGGYVVNDGALLNGGN